MKDYHYVPGWRLNKENNKPAIKHSILMLTTHGIAEGEWNGNEWIQYRWSCKVNDSDVLYWMHLEDLTQLEKEGQPLQQEPRFPQYDNIVEKVFGAGNLESFEYREAEMLVALAKEELLRSLQQEQPEVDLEKEIEEYLDGFIKMPTREYFRKAIKYFYELGLNARK